MAKADMYVTWHRKNTYRPIHPRTDNGFASLAGSVLRVAESGRRLPIDVPLFHPAAESSGSRKAGQKAGQSC